MSRATQIFYVPFEKDFNALPPHVQRAIVEKLDDMGMRLGNYPHYQLTNSAACRLRVGDYRVIYRWDVVRQEIHLLAVGHRREIYR